MKNKKPWQKKVHKAVWKKLKVFPACRVHNKTWAYKISNDWGKVDCVNCLKKKKAVT